VTAALGKDEPDGLPSPALQAACDGLLEAGIAQGPGTPAARWPWTGRTWSPSPGPRRAAPATAPARGLLGHRKSNLRHDEDELFFGCCLSAAVMVPGEQGPAVPELARRMTLSSCRHDPSPRSPPS